MRNPRLLLLGLIQTLTFLVLSQGNAATFPDKPPKEHFYVDQAGLLTATDAVRGTFEAIFGTQ